MQYASQTPFFFFVSQWICGAVLGTMTQYNSQLPSLYWLAQVKPNYHTSNLINSHLHTEVVKIQNRNRNHKIQIYLYEKDYQSKTL